MGGGVGGGAGDGGGMRVGLCCNIPVLQLNSIG